MIYRRVGYIIIYRRVGYSDIQESWLDDIQESGL